MYICVCLHIRTFHVAVHMIHVKLTRFYLNQMLINNNKHVFIELFMNLQSCVTFDYVIDHQ